MIGTNKLATIRKELREAVEASEKDPILWLEEQIAAASKGAKKSDILNSLRRLLDSPQGRERKKRRSPAKK